MVTKTFCDFCKKEIEEEQAHEIQVQRKGLVVVARDACQTCAEKWMAKMP